MTFSFLVRIRKFILLAGALCLLAACSLREPTTVAPNRPTDYPTDLYLQAAKKADLQVYQINSDQSLLTIRAYRDGPLARLGHDHIISSRSVSGYLLIDTQANTCRGDFYLPVSELEVDNADLRQQAGLTTEPSAEDIRGTRENMLNGVLNASAFPFVRASIAQCQPQGGSFQLAVNLTGRVSTQPLITEEFQRDENQLKVSGAFDITQSSFGITPFSALGGLLRVADRLDISYTLKASRMRP